MAAFLHGEVGLAFQELTRGSLQTKADLLATRIATVDAAYESMWDHLRIARDCFAKLGWNTEAYDAAYAVLGPAGTKMAVIDAVNTFGAAPALGRHGLTIRTGGEVGVKVNISGTNTALGVINQMRTLLPEVDWSRPPPPRQVRAPEPDLQVIDDGSVAESVRAPRRGAYIAGAVIVAGVVGVALFLAFATKHNSKKVEDAPPPEHVALTFDDIKGMDTVPLTNNLVRDQLPEDVREDALAELRRRYLAELPTAELQQVFFRAVAAGELDLDAEVFTACAQRLVVLDRPLRELALSMPRGTPDRLLDALGPLLAPKLDALLAEVTTVEDAMALFDLADALHAPADAITAKIAELAARDLKQLDTPTLEMLDGAHDDFALPQPLVDQIEAELATRPM